MASKRELRRQEVEAHNRAHEQRLVEIQARALFGYLGRLGGERKRRRATGGSVLLSTLLASGISPFYSGANLEVIND